MDVFFFFWFFFFPLSLLLIVIRFLDRVSSLITSYTFDSSCRTACHDSIILLGFKSITLTALTRTKGPTVINILFGISSSALAKIHFSVSRFYTWIVFGPAWGSEDAAQFIRNDREYDISSDSWHAWQNTLFENADQWSVVFLFQKLFLQQKEFDPIQNASMCSKFGSRDELVRLPIRFSIIFHLADTSSLIFKFKSSPKMYKPEVLGCTTSTDKSNGRPYNRNIYTMLTMPAVSTTK